MQNKSIRYLFIGAILLSLTTTIFAADQQSKPTKNVIYKITHPFRCSGKKPNWSLNMNDNAFRYQAPGSTDIKMKAVRPKHAEGMKVGFLRVYETQIQNRYKSVTIIVKDNPEGCTDGMSDENHGYDAVVILPNKVLSGCCDMADQQSS